MFKVDYSNQAVRFLKKADSVLIKRIIDKIERLRQEPLQSDTKKLIGIKNMFRIRVGDYRILYEIDFETNVIGIVKIDKRDAAY